MYIYIYIHIYLFFGWGPRRGRNEKGTTRVMQQMGGADTGRSRAHVCYMPRANIGGGQ